MESRFEEGDTVVSIKNNVTTKFKVISTYPNGISHYLKVQNLTEFPFHAHTNEILRVDTNLRMIELTRTVIIEKNGIKR